MSVAKGIEASSSKRMTEVLADVLPAVDPDAIGVLAGPNLAREVIAGHPSATTVAFADPAPRTAIQARLTGPTFRVYTSTDVVGCEIGGAVKNVIAIAAGVADGLGCGMNTMAALVTRGLAELARLGVALGGDPLTFLGLAGNGDLIATCGSPLSRNHRVGHELAAGRDGRADPRQHDLRGRGRHHRARDRRARPPSRRRDADLRDGGRRPRRTDRPTGRDLPRWGASHSPSSTGCRTRHVGSSS